ncbi:MAG: 16S rRNA (guanine(527)-N(7))-methyltransferase RsmG [Chloroflexota bacterium]
MDKLISGAARLGLFLDAAQIKQFQHYAQELLDWNQRVNLTAITSDEEIQTKHFLDSLTVLSGLGRSALPPGMPVMDVGSGAGLPGIPLKIMFPGISLVLLESTGKKAAFLQHVVGTLGLKDVVVVNGRAETVAHVPAYRERFHLVLARAVAALPALVELALPYVERGGCFVAMKKGEITAEVAQADRAITLLGGRLHGITAVDLRELPDRRCLVVIDKVGPTPPPYPRRPGIPEKRPL